MEAEERDEGMDEWRSRIETILRAQNEKLEILQNTVDRQLDLFKQNLMPKHQANGMSEQVSISMSRT